MPVSTYMSSLLGKLLPPCHLLIFSTLLGTELYQTFVMTKVSYNALPRSAFRTLQKRVFPIYFKTQATLLLLNAITFPSGGVWGLSTNKADWIPHLVAGITAILNLSIYEPRTRRSMILVAHQETRDSHVASDGGQGREAEEATSRMQKAKRNFSRDHAMCIHLNLISIGAMVVYGIRLASRLDVA
ncbi:hypothetical protein QBC44DRAFT_376027 [Cladorrhinum sp. PSN332]|nr:hypothetical protein QBC44DRAFT_376027 [Cladorrhinum sp. PSN332]